MTGDADRADADTDDLVAEVRRKTRLEERREARKGTGRVRWGLVWAALCVIVGIPGAVVGVIALLPRSGSTEPAGVLTVVDQKASVLPVYATPNDSTAYSLMRSGAQLRIDCIFEKGNYGYARITGPVFAGYWVDATQLDVQDGTPLLHSNSVPPLC